jgi:hypothetical protein
MMDVLTSDTLCFLASIHIGMVKYLLDRGLNFKAMEPRPLISHVGSRCLRVPTTIPENESHRLIPVCLIGVPF